MYIFLLVSTYILSISSIYTLFSVSFSIFVSYVFFIILYLPVFIPLIIMYSMCISL